MFSPKVRGYPCGNDETEKWHKMIYNLETLKQEDMKISQLKRKNLKELILTFAAKQPLDPSQNRSYQL